MGRDGIDAGATVTRDETRRGRGGGAICMYSVVVVFIFFYSPLMFFSLLFFSDYLLTIKSGTDTEWSGT